MSDSKETKEVWVLEIPLWSGGRDIRSMYTDVYTSYALYLDRVLELTGKGHPPIIRQVLTNTKYLPERNNHD
jgi:hypothetical protein